MSNRNSIVEALERARAARGWTQEELAARAGTSRMTVGRIEAGFDPKLATVYELARALGLELALVPKELASEVQAFIRSGGRVLGQPSGAAAPPSVVELAAVGKGSASSLRAMLSVTPKPSADNLRAALPPATSPAPGSWASRSSTGKPSMSDSAAAKLGRQQSSAPSTGAKK